MVLEGVMGVLRTGGVEAAGRGPAGEGTLIHLDPRQRTTLHPRRVGDRMRRRRHVVVSVTDAARCRRTLSSNAVVLTRSSGNVCSHAGARAPNRYRPGGTSESASSARSRRRRRLRSTAEPTARPMANATCAGFTSGSGTNEHHSGSVRNRTPSRRRRTKVSRSRTRSIKPTDGRGPWPDGTSGRRDPHECSSERGSRACVLGVGCWAGRYASRRSPDDSGQDHEPETNTERSSFHGLTCRGYGRVCTCANRVVQTTCM